MSVSVFVGAHNVLYMKLAGIANIMEGKGSEIRKSIWGLLN